MSSFSTQKRIRAYLNQYREDYPLDRTFEGLDELEDVPAPILSVLFNSVIMKDIARINHIANTENHP